MCKVSHHIRLEKLKQMVLHELLEKTDMEKLDMDKPDIEKAGIKKQDAEKYDTQEADDCKITKTHILKLINNPGLSDTEKNAKLRLLIKEIIFERKDETIKIVYHD